MRPKAALAVLSTTSSLKVGKAEADNRVERSLYERANGGNAPLAPRTASDERSPPPIDRKERPKTNPIVLRGVDGVRVPSCRYLFFGPRPTDQACNRRRSCIPAILGNAPLDRKTASNKKIPPPKGPTQHSRTNPIVLRGVDGVRVPSCRYFFFGPRPTDQACNRRRSYRSSILGILGTLVAIYYTFPASPSATSPHAQNSQDLV